MANEGTFSIDEEEGLLVIKDIDGMRRDLSLRKSCL